MVFATFWAFWVRLPAWLFPLAWVPVESTPNSCLLGRTQAKAILVLYLLEVTGVLLHMF